jgi:hypothetical protein
MPLRILFDIKQWKLFDRTKVFTNIEIDLSGASESQSELCTDNAQITSLIQLIIDKHNIVLVLQLNKDSSRYSCLL